MTSDQTHSSAHENDLGGRFPLYDPASFSGSAKTLYDHAISTIVPEAHKAGFTAMLDDGRMIGPFNPMFASPDIATAMLGLQKAESGNTALGPATRQVVILSTGAVWRAPYELYAHTAEARMVGLSSETIEALIRGEPPPELGEADLTAQRFTLALVGRRQVEDDVFEATRRAFGEKGIFDMIILAGCYQIICSLLNALAITAPQDRGDGRL
ncbi:carboxymuconolactone decarboxylase family protein [Novosphingopyxis sp.]|uniref:carboxymuconolactone decarboxylase family protein n=1 Tax=Novosphingopyxis sp. TaxID=2709690 RepID=UPI003B5A82E6